MTSNVTSTDKFCDTLVSYTYGYPEVDEPIALSKSNVLNFNHQSSEIKITNDMPEEYTRIVESLIVEEDTEDKPFKIASVKPNKICPCCLKLHPTSNDKTIHFYHN